MEIDFMEAISGTAKTVTFARTNICPTCNGSKMKPGTSKRNCELCHGTGYEKQT